MPSRAWVALIVSASINPNYVVVVKYADAASVEINRELIVNTALEKNCDWCLMIDTDMSYPPNLLDVLISRDKDVIGVPYYSQGWNDETKQSTVTPVIYDYDEKQNWHRWEEVKKTEPFKVEAVGMGIILIKTDVFKRLKRPWFFVSTYEDEATILPVGEDIKFCMKCKDAGIEVWVDPTFEDSIGHWHGYGFSKKDCR